MLWFFAIVGLVAIIWIVIVLNTGNTHIDESRISSKHSNSDHQNGKLEKFSQDLNPWRDEISIHNNQQAESAKPIACEKLFFNSRNDKIKELEGPFPLNNIIIEEMLQIPNPGHFAVGSLIDDDYLLVVAIGRSDSDVGAELCKQVGNQSHFMVKIDMDSHSAFWAECELYHLYGTRIGMRHPLRKLGDRWSCPKCGIFNPGP